MFYALCWFAVIALLALWSLAAWALHAAVVWTVSNAGALSGTVSGASTTALKDWLAPWMPPEVARWVAQAVEGLAPLISSVLQAAPALAGVVTVATWVVWGIGSLLLMLLGIGVHLFIANLRRRRGSGVARHARSSLAPG